MERDMDMEKRVLIIAMCVCVCGYNRHRKSKRCIRSICPCRKFEPKFDRNLRGIDM